MTKTNEIKTQEEVKKELKESLTFASVLVEFKNSKFEKAVAEKFFLNNEEVKALKSEIKAVKNIDAISSITIEETAPSEKNGKHDDGKTEFICKATGYHLKIFKDNALKFTKNGFAEILETLAPATQLAIFRKTLLLCAKEKNTSVKTSELVLCGAKTLVKKFIIKIVTEYCKG